MRRLYAAQRGPYRRQPARRGATAQPAGIKFVGGASSGQLLANSHSLSLATLSGGIDSTLDPGDVVLAFWCGGTGGDIAPAFPAEWVTQARLYSNRSYDSVLLGGYKVMGAAPDADITITNTGTPVNNSLALIALAFRGVDTTTPMDVAPTGAINLTAVPDPPAITPVTPGAVIVAVGSGGYLGSAGLLAMSAAYLSGVIAQSHNSGGVNVAALAGHVAWDGLSAYDPAAFTFSRSNSNDSYAARTYALRPA